MSTTSAGAARVKQLANLLSRGRQLHWHNAVQIARQSLPPARWPEAPPPVVTLVYKGAQLCLATVSVEARGYLAGDALDQFSAGLFRAVSGADLARVHRLASTYAERLDDPRSFIAVVARDLCHAMTRGTDEEHVRALSGAPLALRKTTQLYCAQVFGDAALVRQLS